MVGEERGVGLAARTEDAPSAATMVKGKGGRWKERRRGMERETERRQVNSVKPFFTILILSFTDTRVWQHIRDQYSLVRVAQNQKNISKFHYSS